MITSRLFHKERWLVEGFSVKRNMIDSRLFHREILLVQGFSKTIHDPTLDKKTLLVTIWRWFKRWHCYMINVSWPTARSKTLHIRSYTMHTAYCQVHAGHRVLKTDPRLQMQDIQALNGQFWFKGCSFKLGENIVGKHLISF